MSKSYKAQQSATVLKNEDTQLNDRHLRVIETLIVMFVYRRCVMLYRLYRVDVCSASFNHQEIKCKDKKACPVQ